ncbi:universal stress protein [Bacillus tianshenii]|nr:universal stress protein [Bacillus tianshenii]
MLNQYDRILVAYDGSELSRKSLQQAIEVARENENTEIHVVSVVNPTGSPTNAVIQKNIIKELKENTEKKMAEVKEEIKGLSNAVHTKVLEGAPGKALCKYADDNDIQLIVMGSRGLGNIKEIFLGSVSHNVLKYAHCPVLIMK